MSTTVDQLVEQRDMLPKHCPAWCTGSHAQGLEEGCDLESASVHIAPDVGFHAPRLLTRDGTEIRPFAGGVRVALHAAHRPGEYYWDAPLIDLECHTVNLDGVTVALTSGEARVLARQLVHLADLADLD